MERLVTFVAFFLALPLYAFGPAGQVLDLKGTPISQAQIFIQELNLTTQTDSRGQFNWPDGARFPLTLHINAANTLPTTFAQVKGVYAQYVLAPAPTTRTVLSGITSGYENLSVDGWIDFSVILPGFFRRQIFDFDPTAIVSPLKDRITVLGQEAKVPSNISLPKQTENYVFPVTINKLNFRLLYREENQPPLIATAGRFPFQQVVDRLRNNAEFADIIYLFQMKSMGHADVLSPTQNFNININEQKFDKLWTLPPTDVSSDSQHIAIALAQHQDGYYLTDVKMVTSKQPTKLTTLTNSPARLAMHLLRSKESSEIKGSKGFWQLSMALQAESQTTTPNFLGLLEKPQVQGQQVFLNPPTRPASVNAMGMAVHFWLVQSETVGSETFENTTLWWQFYSDEWLNSLMIPSQVFVGLPVGSKLRLEVTYLAGSGQNEKTSTLTFEKATYASKNKLDLM